MKKKEPPVMSRSLQDRQDLVESWLLMELEAPELLPRIVSMATFIVG